MTALFPLPREAADAPAPLQSVDSAVMATLQSEATAVPVVYLDLDYWDSHKVATDPRFVIRDGLNERRW